MGHWPHYYLLSQVSVSLAIVGGIC